MKSSEQYQQIIESYHEIKNLVVNGNTSVSYKALTDSISNLGYVGIPPVDTVLLNLKAKTSWGRTLCLDMVKDVYLDFFTGADE